MSSLGVQQRDGVESELSGRRQETIAKLWNITETLNVLYRENWTLMANVEMIKFQNEMIQSIKQEMRPGGAETGGREGCNHSKETIVTDRYIDLLNIPYWEQGITASVIIMKVLLSVQW